MAISIDNFKQVLIDGLKLEDITVDDIDNNSALFGEEGIGLDSVDSIELVLIIEKEYGVKIDDSLMENSENSGAKSFKMRGNYEVEFTAIFEMRNGIPVTTTNYTRVKW